MSFRGNDSRHYGHVPPAQYPVPGQTFESHLSSLPLHVPRHPSFDHGDDQACHPDPGTSRPPPHSPTPTYNPQDFVRSPSMTTLPFHLHHPPTTSSTYATPTSPRPSDYTPQTYNPAAYANTNNNHYPPRQPTGSGYSYTHTGSLASPVTPQLTSSSWAHQPVPVAPTAPAYNSAQSTYRPSHSPSHSPSQQQLSHALGYSSTSTTSHTSPSVNQPPYPTTYSHIPVGPNYSAATAHYTNNNHHYYSSPRPSPRTSPVPPPPSGSSPGLQRHPTNAPLPSRPLDDAHASSSSNWDSTVDRRRPREDSAASYHSRYGNHPEVDLDDLRASAGSSRLRPNPINGNVSNDNLDRLRRQSSTVSSTNNMSSTTLGRYTSSASRQSPSYVAEAEEEDDSDPEAAGGVLAMQEAAMMDWKFSTTTTTTTTTTPPCPDQQPRTDNRPAQPTDHSGVDGDLGGMDLGMYGGGYDGGGYDGMFHYGNDVASPSTDYLSTPLESTGRPLPMPHAPSRDVSPFYTGATVDYGGTGGLQPPQAPQPSLSDDDDRVSIPSGHDSGSPCGNGNDDYLRDIFFHPGLSSRPLPAIPAPSEVGPQSTAQQQRHRATYPPDYAPSTNDTRYSYPSSVAQNHYDQQAAVAQPNQPQYHQHLYTQQQQCQQYQQPQQPQQHLLQPERSVSLLNHSNTPSVQTPARSRTDAAEERRRAQRQQALKPPLADYDSGVPSSLTAYDISLPSGRRKKFVPAKLSSADLKQCSEPWALSGITNWIRDIAEGEPDLKRKTIEEALIRLFTHKVPTMNVADAESLSAIVTDSMLAVGILIPEEEWVKFGPGSMSGVLWQLTGSGCYASQVHHHEDQQAARLASPAIPLRCYSPHCGRTLRKANLDHLLLSHIFHAVDWKTHYNMSDAQMEAKPKKERERQFNLHEIVTGEEEYMSQLDVLRHLYRDQIRHAPSPLIKESRLEKFLHDVFGKVDAVQQVNKDFLLAQLKYRQQVEGPWISGFSDIFREWIRKAEPVYIAYCATYPNAQHLIRKEAEKNLLFRQFLNIVREHPHCKRLEWTTFIKAPITRLQRYSLLLDVVRRNTTVESEEKSNLVRAIEEIKAVTHRCDEKVDEESKKVGLKELQSSLILRPGFQSVLNLDHLGRKLIRQGDLLRMGSKGVRWVDTHALLFDHYFILAKAVHAKDGHGDSKFDVSKEPIPMPLLFLESMNDDAVSKQKGLAAPLARTTAAGTDTKLNKTMTTATNGADRPSNDSGGAPIVTRLAPGTSNDTESRILYPFRVKHLGHEVYTLYATSHLDRQEWCNAIIEAKTQHARALHAQNAEPFRLRVVADAAFAYDTTTAMVRPPGVSIRGTPLNRAIREMEVVYGPGRGPPPVSRAQVNCATGFRAFGRSLIAIGTDYGVFVSAADDPRGWQRTLAINRVTQIAVLEEFSVCLVIADKSLISYSLDLVAHGTPSAPPLSDSTRRAPQRLAKDVSFFATACMKDRMLIFYKRREGMHAMFRVLEPVLHRATERRLRFLPGRRGSGGGDSGSGMTESFRDFDDFYLPTECYSLNLFQTYIAVATAKGFELLTLDKKLPNSIPRDLSTTDTANIASRIRDQRPLGMFKLNDTEFLLTYEDCAVYVDKHGEVSRTLIMEYSGKQKKARGATMFGQFLLLFSEDYVEVRNALNGRLRQIIAGRDVRCLDYGFRGPTGGNGSAIHTSVAGPDSKGTVKICMSHPEVPGGQIVLEMLLNEGHLEKA